MRYFRLLAFFVAVAVVSCAGAQTPQVPPPDLNPQGQGCICLSVTITISDSLAGTTIYYTLDGTMPTTNSTLYTGPVTITQTTFLRTIAVKAGFVDSLENGATYSIYPPQ